MRGALRVGGSLALPIDIVGESTAILAKKGAGKSNTAKVVVEETLDHGGVQVIVLDPIGHWWSLRAGADGKPKGGYPIAVFGGMHGDLPLEPTAGKLLAQTTVESGQSMILDVSSLDSDGAMQRFVYEFLEELYRLKQATPTPVLLVLEEADEFAPQNTQGANVPRMVGAANRISKRGRGRGIGMLYVTQRSAALNKNVLDQSDTLIVMRTIGPRDRTAIESWVKYQQADGIDAVLPSLASLATGEAWIWTPERQLLERVKIRKARTFDSSQTPKPGEAAVIADVKPIDVDALGEAIKATVERVKENDPAELRKRIRQLEQAAVSEPEWRRRISELERRLEERPAETVVERIEVPVLTDEERYALAKFEALGEVSIEQWRSDATELERIIGKIGATLAPPAARAETVERREEVRPVRPVPARPPARPPSPPAAPGDVHLKAGAVRILETFARHYPMRMTKAQLGTLAKFKITGGTFGTYWSTLKRAGYVFEDGSEVGITETGLERVGHVPREPLTTEELLEQWRDVLKAGARQMLDELVAGRYWWSKAELAERVGMTASGGTFGTYLSTLRRNGLVDVDGDQVRASDTLFMGSTVAA